MALTGPPLEVSAGGDCPVRSSNPLLTTPRLSLVSQRSVRQPPGALCQLRELTYRYRTKKGPDGEVILVPRTLGRWDSAADVLRPLLEDEAVEVFGVLCLTTRRSVICWHEVARGSVNGTAFQMGDVFRAAVMANADALIVAHNHPSGDPEPSIVDLQMTTALRQAGALMRIAILDHMIVGCGRVVSLRRDYPSLFAAPRVDHAVGYGGNNVLSLAG
jgi:proteasome lid subunit RPN8/RPN11